MTPERRKEICLDQASRSRLGSTCSARRERMRLIGSDEEADELHVVDKERRWRRTVVREVVAMR